VALFARENELRSVYDLVARSGTGGALVLRGAAGVGKTALLNEIISASRRADIRVLSTAGISLQMQQPFAGLAHLMRSVLNDPELVGRNPAAWDTVRAAIGSEDVPISSPFSVAYAVLDVLSAWSARQRVLLVVDDAAWVDEQSWRVLSFIGRRIDFDQIVLIMAVRDGVEGDRRLRDVSLPTLRIEPLPDEAAAALPDHVAPGLDPRIRSRILLEAGGNPLGLLELSDEAKRRGLAAKPGTSMLLPDRLEQTFAGAVSELPDAARSLLLTAAFNDSHSLQEALDATALAFGVPVALEDLDPAISARLVSVEDGFELRFRHPLVCSALRQATSVSDRCRAHAAFAEVLRDEPERSIWHRAAATVGKDDELARGLASVARRARQRGAVAVAVSALERSAQLTADVSVGASRLLWAALAAAEMGDVATVERLVHSVGGVRLSASAQARLAWLHETYLGSPWSGSIRLRTLLNVVREMRAAGEIDLALDSLVVMSLRAWWSSPDRETREMIVSMAQSLDESLSDLRAVYVIAVVAPLERGSWVLTRLTNLAGAAETDPERLHLLAGAATAVGAVGLSNVLHAEAVAGFRRQGRLGTLTRALAGQAWAAVLLGNTRVALTASSEAGALGNETGYPGYALVADLARAASLALRGETAAAADVLDGAEAALVPTGGQALFPMVQLARGLGALASGRPDDAYEQLLRTFSAAGAGVHPSQKFAMVAHLAEAAARSGQLDRLRPIVAELAPVAATTRSPALVMSLTYADALLAQETDAGESLRRALEADLSAWPFERARLQIAYGARLRHGRRRRESRSYLRAAGETFEALGARPWADWAWQELRASGETVRRAEDPSAHLSPQELQVATMAAQGLTNRQIASLLFLSPRTVSTHLYHIYPKVGVTTRNGLQRVLAARPTASARVE
jgi:DNA-binding CsgD family transcriptional regulator